MEFVNGFEYLIEENIDSENFLSNNYQNMIDYYIKFKKEKFFDVGLENTPIPQFFSPKIKKIINDLFIIDNSNIDIIYNMYAQDNSNLKQVYHNHIHHPVSICGVFYTNLPKKGGEFNIIHPPFFTQEKPFSFKPQINKIYFFPSWLYHCPSPQEDKEKRICINIAYTSHTKPIVKNYEIVW